MDPIINPPVVVNRSPIFRFVEENIFWLALCSVVGIIVYIVENM
jgi:hypothetical protein